MNGATQTYIQTPCPKALTVIANDIPAELKKLNHWVTWKFEFRDRWTKPPYRVDGLSYAKGNAEDSPETHSGEEERRAFAIVNQKHPGTDARACITNAIEDDDTQRNPASRMGKFNKRGRKAAH